MCGFKMDGYGCLEFDGGLGVIASGFGFKQILSFLYFEPQKYIQKISF